MTGMPKYTHRLKTNSGINVIGVISHILIVIKVSYMQEDTCLVL